ncbi:hypothetical protein FO519_001143 [Halicephalobus sp. NKZ332]|nr:hypothetical protein FO519_001143 [Halicephalobus sp. NKZ332]
MIPNDEFTYKVIRNSMKALALDYGFTHAEPDAIDDLTSIVYHYLCKIVCDSKQLAEIAGKKSFNFKDVVISTTKTGIDIDALNELMTCRDSVPAPDKLSEYPVQIKGNSPSRKPITNVYKSAGTFDDIVERISSYPRPKYDRNITPKSDMIHRKKLTLSAQMEAVEREKQLEKEKLEKEKREREEAQRYAYQFLHTKPEEYHILSESRANEVTKEIDTPSKSEESSEHPKDKKKHKRKDKKHRKEKNHEHNEKKRKEKKDKSKKEKKEKKKKHRELGETPEPVPKKQKIEESPSEPPSPLKGLGLKLKILLPPKPVATSTPIPPPREPVMEKKPEPPPKSVTPISSDSSRPPSSKGSHSSKHTPEKHRDKQEGVKIMSERVQLSKALKESMETVNPRLTSSGRLVRSERRTSESNSPLKKKKRPEEKKPKSSSTQSSFETFESAPGILQIPDEQGSKDDEKYWYCPNCKIKYTEEANMICCERCNYWYHWHCVGLMVEPTESDWYCRRCLDRMAKRK